MPGFPSKEQFFRFWHMMAVQQEEAACWASFFSRFRQRCFRAGWGAGTRDLAVGYLDGDEELVRNIPGAIGNGILQSFRTVIFDVPHRQIIFELAPEPRQPGLAASAVADR